MWRTSRRPSTGTSTTPSLRTGTWPLPGEFSRKCKYRRVEEHCIVVIMIANIGNCTTQTLLGWDGRWAVQYVKSWKWPTQGLSQSVCPVEINWGPFAFKLEITQGQQQVCVSQLLSDTQTSFRPGHWVTPELHKDLKDLFEKCICNSAVLARYIEILLLSHQIKFAQNVWIIKLLELNYFRLYFLLFSVIQINGLSSAAAISADHTRHLQRLDSRVVDYCVTWPRQQEGGCYHCQAWRCRPQVLSEHSTHSELAATRSRVSATRWGVLTTPARASAIPWTLSAPRAALLIFCLTN